MKTKFKKNILCIGAGYVGGPTMAMIAYKCPQYKVTVVDINPIRISEWNSNDLPVYEPGLDAIVKKTRGRNLFFSSNMQQGIIESDIIFVSVNGKKIEAEVDKLNKTINNIKIEIERLKLNKTEGLQTSIDDIKAEINTLNLEKGIISNIKVIQEPEVSLHLVKPKKKQIVLLTTVVALFMAVFLAFFIEYIKNATRSTKQTK